MDKPIKSEQVDGELVEYIHELLFKAEDSEWGRKIIIRNILQYRQTIQEGELVDVGNWVCELVKKLQKHMGIKEGDEWKRVSNTILKWAEKLLQSRRTVTLKWLTTFSLSPYKTKVKMLKELGIDVME